eukprot:SAG31_NODE_4057_length_3630_cov_3.786746_1_plen_114_part_00
MIARPDGFFLSRPQGTANSPPHRKHVARCRSMWFPRVFLAHATCVRGLGARAGKQGGSGEENKGSGEEHKGKRREAGDVGREVAEVAEAAGKRRSGFESPAGKTVRACSRKRW